MANKKNNKQENENLNVKNNSNEEEVEVVELPNEKKTFGQKFKEMPRKKKVIGGIVLTAVLATAIAVPCALLLQHPIKVNVTSNTLTFSNSKAEYQKDYKTNVALKNNDVNTLPNEITVKVGDKVLDASKQEYTYTVTSVKTATLTIPGKYVTADLSFIGEGKQNGFADDSWKTITDYLNAGGVRALKERYKVKSLLGAEHDVVVDGKTYKVVVIAENHDIIASDYNKSASLTLCFEDVFETKYDARITSEHSYTNSTLQNKCKEIYEKIEDETLKNQIQEVSKSTAYTDSVRQWGQTYEISYEKVFALSLKEIGGLNVYTEDTDGSPIVNKVEEEYCYNTEGSVYTAFNQSISTTYKTLANIAKNKKIWTRTPSVNLEERKAFTFDSKKQAFEKTDVSENAYIIPAFNIGAETSFSSDSWDNIISYANEGFGRLQEVYGLDTFIGQERRIYLNDNTLYRVRVIGENHDSLTTEDNETAALTFEFECPIDNTAVSMSEYQLFNWETSKARNYLNSTVLSLIPENIRNGIQYVKKSSSIYSADEERKYPATVETNDRLFILSYKELGARDSHLDYHDFDKTETNILSHDPFAREGFTYEYYQKEYQKYDILRNKTYPTQGARIKGYGYTTYSEDVYTPNSQKYWIRSGNAADEKTGYFVDNTLGENSGVNLTTPTDKLDIIPCFCIGKTGTYSFSNVFEKDSWENLAKNAEKGLSELKRIYGLNENESFVGKTKSIVLNKGTVAEKTLMVRVIGEDYDVLASDPTKKAALTFEFVNCVNSSICFDDNNSNVWSTSSLREYCNTVVLNSLPQEIVSHVKEVRKTTSRYGSTTPEITSEKVFPLSQAEIGEDYDDSGYQYYRFDKDYSDYLEVERYKGGAYYQIYNLREPDLYAGGSNIIRYISANGKVLNTKATQRMGLAPAFAI